MFQVSGFRFQGTTTRTQDDEAIRAPSDPLGQSHSATSADSLRISLSRAFLQCAYQDFLRK